MFTPLRIHSVYSRGKGSATLEEASAWVSRKGMGAAALTDIENLYGWAKWKRAAEARGFRPIFGCELEIDGRQFVFLVKSREGSWNLMEIFNQKGRRPAEEDGERAEATKAGTLQPRTQGLITVYIPKPDDMDLHEELNAFRGEDFYLGCDFANFERAGEGARAYNLPVVWANPIKFIRTPH